MSLPALVPLAAMSGFAVAAVLMYLLQRALDRKKIDQALAREGDVRFRRFVETAHEGVVATDSVGEITYVNDRAAVILGRPAAELQGRQLFTFMSSESSFAARTLFAGAELRTAELNEFAFHTPNDEEIWTLCSSSPITTETGEFDGALIMITDITQRRTAERALIQANQTLTTLVDAAPLPIVVIDRDNRVTLWNPAAQRLFGWTTDEVLGRPLPTVGPDARADFLEQRRREERGEELRGVEARRRRRDGSEVAIYLSSAPVRGADGNIIGSIGMYIDITERKQLEAQLNQAQKMEAVGQLAGGVAHDFNNILTVIKANASFLADGCPACATPLPEIREIDEAANRAAGLTYQLLAFSRRQVVRPQVLDVPTALGKLTTLLRRLVPENIAQHWECAEDAGRVSIDASQFEQIVINLVVNARDAMPAGGHLTIGAAQDRLGAGDWPRFGGTRVEKGDYVRITVADTGTGMTAQTISHVFEPFFTTKAVGRGTGLGLATVYGIVKQNRGYINVTSQPGAGTTIGIWLPICSEAVVSERRAEVSGDLSGTETILLVEDEDSIRRITERLLRAKGYTVLSAATGDAALELANASREPIHLLLTDVIMPGMSGTALADVLTAHHPELGVLFMSGYADELIAREDALASTTQLLEKPFGPEQLFRQVRAALGRSPG